MTSIIKNARLTNWALGPLLFIERRRGNADTVASLTNIGLPCRFRGHSSLLSMLIGVHGNLRGWMCLNGRRRLLRSAPELAHHTVPARMDTLVMSALKAQKRGGQNGRRDKGDQTPKQIAGSRCRAKKVTQEQREAALGTTGAARQRDGGTQQFTN